MRAPLAERVDPRRVRTLRPDPEPDARTVVYWMSRDQRAADNWALLHAQDLAIARHAPLVVAFCLAPTFAGATRGAYRFMLDGLRETARTLDALRIPLRILAGEPPHTLPAFCAAANTRLLVTDFDPLRPKRAWKDALLPNLHVPVFEVDAHNIVPCWLASPKLEYGAYTLRPKLNRLLPAFLTDFPALAPHPFPCPPASAGPPPNWDALAAALRCAPLAPTAPHAAPGPAAALARLHAFTRHALDAYDAAASDPAAAGQSGLSPYLHFGQLAPQRAALAAHTSPARASAVAAFLEQLIVRRELADNFCWYQPDYDRPTGFPAWARATLARHAADPRPVAYTPAQLEQAATADPLWNAAQQELVKSGRMHGYLRMYWAKKILEWSPSPADALALTIELNDRYQLDGRDPNGYVGAMWSIGGVHDRPWQDRPIFGQIRYMNDRGCHRKFDVDAYLRRIAAL